MKRGMSEAPGAATYDLRGSRPAYVRRQAPAAPLDARQHRTRVVKIGVCCGLHMYVRLSRSSPKLHPTRSRQILTQSAMYCRVLGSNFVSLSLSAADMGLPVDRQRLYMAGVRASEGEDVQGIVESVMVAIKRSVVKVRKVCSRTGERVHVRRTYVRTYVHMHACTCDCTLFCRRSRWMMY